jgi:hypothetical protein
MIPIWSFLMRKRLNQSQGFSYECRLFGIAGMNAFRQIRGPSYPVRTPENVVVGGYLDVPKGMMTGKLWAAAIWSVAFAALNACL